MICLVLLYNIMLYFFIIIVMQIIIIIWKNILNLKTILVVYVDCDIIDIVLFMWICVVRKLWLYRDLTARPHSASCFRSVADHSTAICDPRSEAITVS